MIEEVDERLKTWASGILEDIPGEEVNLLIGPPSPDLSGQGVSFYLLELTNDPVPRAPGRLPIRLCVRYLVTTWADSDEEAHHLLDTLLLAAMDDNGFEVALEPPSAETWTALGVRPRPSFILRTVVQSEHPERPEPKRVRVPLVVRLAAVARLEGTLLSTDDIPLMDAQVEFPMLNLSTITDSKGRFLFPNVPLEPVNKELVIKTKGREFRVSVEQRFEASEAILVRVDPLQRTEE